MAHHLTLEERDRVVQLRHQGADKKEIAKALGRCPSTISRELRPTAHAAITTRHRPSERPIDGGRNPRCNARWKIPDRSGHAHRIGDRSGRRSRSRDGCDKKESDRCVSSQTIYTWIKRDKDREHWEAMLRRRGKRPNRRKNATTTADAARIDNRPEAIEERLRLGDFEGDTVLGPPGTGGLATLVDRKSRFTVIVKVQSRTPTMCMRKSNSV